MSIFNSLSTVRLLLKLIERANVTMRKFDLLFYSELTLTLKKVQRTTILIYMSTIELTAILVRELD